MDMTGMGQAASGVLGTLTGIAGALIRGGDKVPDFTKLYRPVDVTKVQKEAIAGNLAALPTAAELTTKTNILNQKEVQRMLEVAFPGAAESLQTNISSMLRGEVPADVTANIMRASAGRALGGGFAGSGLYHNLSARDLGLTSLEVQTQGINQMIATAPFLMGNPMSVQSMFMTPQQRLDNAMRQADTQLQLGVMQEQARVNARGLNAVIGETLMATGGAMAGAGFGGAMDALANRGQANYLPPTTNWGGFGTLGNPYQQPSPGYNYSQPYLNPASWSNPASYAQAQAYYE